MNHRLRSVLYMPATNPRAIAKARDLPCDAVILDLEDAVAPDAKVAARAAAVAAVAEGFGDSLRAIRLNALDTRWGADDARAAGQAAVDAIVLPKIASPADLVAARAAIGADGPPIWAMIETPAAILALPAIAAAMRETRTQALIAGTNDLAKDLRCRPGDDRMPLIPALSAIVTAARAVGAAALDGVCNAIREFDRLTTECEQGARLGFDGKTLIHPGQIEIANAAFGPTPEDIAWAEAVVAGFATPEARGKGAIQVGGAMVELLHLDEARRILAN